VLSGLAATSANEFFEVALGGLITLPAAVTFLGVAGVAGMGTFGLGFNVLPMVFANMAFGGFFGFLFFFLLFLAAVTSSLSMLQPGIAFLEEALKINRKQSVALLGGITAVGCGFVVYFSEGVKALDTMDFWVGTFLIFVLSTIQIIIFGWVLGIDKGFELAHEGASIRIPRVFKFIMKFVSPIFLLLIFAMWVASNVFGIDFKTGDAAYSGYIRDLFIEPNIVAWLSISLIAGVAALFVFIISLNPDYKKLTKKD
jgi:NSS family neurotransmitter:Na+ symporter